jgi:hypothetical protein
MSDDSRWKCPQCSSKNVQIGLPAWHTETTDMVLTYVETDSEADIMWWYCADCGESDSGHPAEVEEQ